MDMSVDVNKSGSLRQRASFSHDQESHCVDSSSSMNDDLAFPLLPLPWHLVLLPDLNIAPTGTKLDLLRSTVSHSAQTLKTLQVHTFPSVLILPPLPQQFLHLHQGRTIHLRLKRMPIRILLRPRNHLCLCIPRAADVNQLSLL